MLVGECPGDREDLEGHPFVGPAGGLLRRIMEEVGLRPADAYMTNAVKHFRFEQRGKRRIHQKPTTEHVTACHPWLDLELGLLHPQLVLALGATAARALLGHAVTIGKVRGERLDWDGPGSLLVTIHPSAVLRTADEDRSDALDAFRRDLAAGAKLLRDHS